MDRQMETHTVRVTEYRIELIGGTYAIKTLNRNITTISQMNEDIEKLKFRLFNQSFFRGYLTKTHERSRVDKQSKWCVRQAWIVDVSPCTHSYLACRCSNNKQIEYAHQSSVGIVECVELF